MGKMEITDMEKNHIRDLIKSNKRPSERDFDEMRDVEIETGIAKKAEGSAKVSLGDTEVIAGVKIDVGDPFPDTPDEGILMVSAEFGPLASPEFEMGPPGEDATELARVVDRGLRESEAVDFSELCIKEGEKVWKIMVDIHILNHAGNLMDASALAAAKAIHEAKIPVYEDGKVNHEELDKDLKVLKTPIACTITKIEDKLLVDADLKEEKTSDAEITVTWIEEGLCSIQKRGSGGFTPEEIKEAFKLAKEKASELREKLGE
ncbi:MAG: exosome complex protein Rrp42 [Candidatus Aenigmatarchaeota archaeon]